MSRNNLFIDLSSESDEEKARLVRESVEFHSRLLLDASQAQPAWPAWPPRRMPFATLVAAPRRTSQHRTEQSEIPRFHSHYFSEPVRNVQSFPTYSQAQERPSFEGSRKDPTLQAGVLERQQEIEQMRNEAMNGIPSRDPSRGANRSARATFVSTSSTTRSIPLKSHRSLAIQTRACMNCREVDVSCDGEQPCSACVEPGVACIYPGEAPESRPNQANYSTSTTKTLSSSMREASQVALSTKDAISTSHESKSLLSTRATQQSDLDPNKLLALHLKRPGQQTFTSSLPNEPFFDSDESDDDDDDDDEIRLAISGIEEVKSLLKKHEARMRDYRAYLLQPLLNQAKLDGRNAPGPTIRQSQPNPFVKLVKAKANKSGISLESPALQLQMKSHKMSAPRKWTYVSAPLTVVETDSTILPKYKSIGRLGASLLAPNIRTLKYWPYFPDEENLDPSEAKKNEELEERYQHDDNHLLAQRKCSELIDLWRPWAEDFVSKLGIEFRDILYWFLTTTESTMCDTCDREIQLDVYQDVSRLLQKPTERSLTLARLSAMAFNDVSKISMWHIALGAPSVKDLVRQIEVPKKHPPSLCSICFTHNCLSHGAYQEPEEIGGTAIMGGNIEINDEELEHNVRITAAIDDYDYADIHQCGLYCVGPEVRIKDILGRRRDGTIGGIHNSATHVPRLTFGNSHPCSESCYWSVDKRTRFAAVMQAKDHVPEIPERSKAMFRRLLRIYSDNQRVPCMLAKEISHLSCLDAFYLLLAETQLVSHYQSVDTQTSQRGTRKISKIAAGLDTTLSADLDERPPFIPCSHSGPCLNNPNCTCAQSKVHCEWFCGCDKTCERRFSGCKCASANKSCFNDKSCECWKHNRECDPWLCGTCGVVEVLDPGNKYRDEMRQGRCRNNHIQLELPIRTIKAPSEVQGWGLYAGEDVDENDFIGEYKGETVGNQESDRRGAVYANIGQEYLFVMNRDQQIDGSNFGNKTRFINNSQREDYINVLAKKLLCNGIQRVMLYAKRPIQAGEELLYNYNYPISVTQKFWERGEGPTNMPSAVVAKPSITWTQPRVTGRYSKVAGKHDGEPSPARVSAAREEEEAPMTRKEAKRKRASEADLSHAYPAGTALGVAVGANKTRARVHLPEDVGDSDFELVNVSESSVSVGDGETHDNDSGISDSDDAGVLAAVRRRRRIVHPNDGRRGGLAQAKAWETRRQRSAKGK